MSLSGVEPALSGILIAAVQPSDYVLHLFDLLEYLIKDRDGLVYFAIAVHERQKAGLKLRRRPVDTRLEIGRAHV